MNGRRALVVLLAAAAAATASFAIFAGGAESVGGVAIPAKVVDFTPQSTRVSTYATTDFGAPGPADDRQGTTDWRVVMGTGNAAELWLTVTKEGRLLDLGGRYINYSDDFGQTWKSVQPQEPLANAEGSIAVAPNGDVLGVTWDPYSGDRVLTYKYNAASRKWFYMENLLHTPFWDRPGLDVVPGPFAIGLGADTVPYITFINGFPHDPWQYSTDGLNYQHVSSLAGDRATTQPISSWLDVPPDPAFDWIQPNLFFTFAALGNGRALQGTSMFDRADMKWHRWTLPNGSTIPGRLQVDGRGWLHNVRSVSGGFEYRISSDGARTWKGVTVTEPSPSPGAGDFRAVAAAGVAAVWALKGRQDLVFKFDISTDQPRLMRRYVVGKGDDTRVGTIGTYGLTGGHRFDFPSVVVFPDGRVGVSFMDTTTTMLFPTLGTHVVAPGLALELDTTLP